MSSPDLPGRDAPRALTRLRRGTVAVIVLVVRDGYGVGEDGSMWWRVDDGRWLRDPDPARAAGTADRRAAIAAARDARDAEVGTAA